MTGFSPSFLFLAGFLQNIQKRLIFLAAFRAHIQVFAHQRHELRRVLLADLSFYVFVDPGIDFVAGNILFSYAFEYTQKSQHSVVGNLLIVVEAAFNLLDESSDVHNLCL